MLGLTEILATLFQTQWIEPNPDLTNNTNLILQDEYDPKGVPNQIVIENLPDKKTWINNGEYRIDHRARITIYVKPYRYDLTSIENSKTLFTNMKTEIDRIINVNMFSTNGLNYMTIAGWDDGRTLAAGRDTKYKGEPILFRSAQLVTGTYYTNNLATGFSPPAVGTYLVNGDIQLTRDNVFNCASQALSWANVYTHNLFTDTIQNDQGTSITVMNSLNPPNPNVNNASLGGGSNPWLGIVGNTIYTHALASFVNDNIVLTGNLMPTNNSYSLGGPNNYFSDIYVNNIHSSGSSGTVSTTGDLLPSEDNAFSLGNIDYAWSNVETYELSFKLVSGGSTYVSTLTTGITGSNKYLYSMNSLGLGTYTYPFNFIDVTGVYTNHLQPLNYAYPNGTPNCIDINCPLQYIESGNYLVYTGSFGIGGTGTIRVTNYRVQSTGDFGNLFLSKVLPSVYNGQIVDQTVNGDPILYWDSIFFAEKDIEAFGSLNSTSDPQKGFGGGALMLGTGFTGVGTPPLIDLTGTIYGMLPNGSLIGTFGTYPTSATYGSSTWWYNSAKLYQGSNPMYPNVTSNYYNTLFLMTANASDMIGLVNGITYQGTIGNLYLNNITLNGIYGVKGVATSYNDLVEIGTLHIRNATPTLSLELANSSDVGAFGYDGSNMDLVAFMGNLVVSVVTGGKSVIFNSPVQFNSTVSGIQNLTANSPLSISNNVISISSSPSFSNLTISSNINVNGYIQFNNDAKIVWVNSGVLGIQNSAGSTLNGSLDVGYLFTNNLLPLTGSTITLSAALSASGSVGSNGQVLTSQGAGNIPTWSSPASISFNQPTVNATFKTITSDGLIYINDPTDTPSIDFNRNTGANLFYLGYDGSECLLNCSSLPFRLISSNFTVDNSGRTMIKGLNLGACSISNVTSSRSLSVDRDSVYYTYTNNSGRTMIVFASVFIYGTGANGYFASDIVLDYGAGYEIIGNAENGYTNQAHTFTFLVPNGWSYQIKDSSAAGHTGGVILQAVQELLL